jgi:hypothetical protein
MMHLSKVGISTHPVQPTSAGRDLLAGDPPPDTTQSFAAFLHGTTVLPERPRTTVMQQLARGRLLLPQLVHMPTVLQQPGEVHVAAAAAAAAASTHL